MIELARRAIQLARQVKLNTLVAEAGDRDDAAEMVPTARAKPGFLAQLALGACSGALARAPASGGNLPQPAPDRMAPLAKQRHAATLVERHDGAGARMAYDRQINRHAVGEFGFFDAEVHHAKFQYFAPLCRHIPALR